jgi:TolB protein
VQIYSNPFFQVSLQYPEHWQHVEGEPQSGDRFAGDDGFFLVSAMDGGDMSLDEVAASEGGHVLQPYGSQPTVKSLAVAGQEARLILPSADQSMGPHGQAALVVRFPVPVEIGGHLYPLFVLTADPDHILDLAASLQFIIN